MEETKAINPWLIAITVTLATFMESMNTRRDGTSGHALDRDNTALRRYPRQQ
jgi:hypothetical protein